MKVKGMKTTAILIGLSLFVFAACGKKQTVPSVMGNGIYAGTCSQDTNGENVYVGDIDPAAAFNSGSTGSIVLTVTSTGGSYGQFMATASVTLDGMSFCCQSQGTSILGPKKGVGEKATIADAILSCQSNSTDPTFGSYYQSVILKVGVNCPFSYEWTEAAITTDKRLIGCIEFTTGLETINGNQRPPYFVQ